jgi:hypothetical protein
VSPKVLAILAVIVIVIVAGMALTMKRAAEKRRDRTAAVALLDEAVLHRVVDEVHVRVEPQLLEDAPAIGAHRRG